MGKRLIWPLAVCSATLVSLALILVLIWYEMDRGSWTVNLLSPALLLPLAALLIVIHSASSVLAAGIRRLTRLSLLLVLPVASGLILFTYISWVIVTVNPAGRTYVEALAYAAEDIAVLTIAGVVGGVAAAAVLTWTRPTAGLNSPGPELSTRCRSGQGCD